MTKYEYDLVTLELSDEQKQVAAMGLGDVAVINAMILPVLNERAAAGWEPLYPFSVPQIWFRKAITSRRTAKTRKRITKKKVTKKR